MAFLDEIITTLHSSIGRYPEALSYLASRQVTPEEIELYRIGYSKVLKVPDDPSPERKRFMDETWRGEKLEERVVFPFQNPIGRVVGLAGRAIKSKEFKNFATAEAKHDGFFFGLPQAFPHIIKENRVFVVEGYFDLLAFRKVFPNVVASITAGINEPQHDQLLLYCDRIVTCFDSDPPGRAGADKAAAVWKDVRTMCLKNKDPAACLAAIGIREFERHVRSESPI